MKATFSESKRKLEGESDSQRCDRFNGITIRLNKSTFDLLALHKRHNETPNETISRILELIEIEADVAEMQRVNEELRP